MSRQYFRKYKVLSICCVFYRVPPLVIWGRARPGLEAVRSPVGVPPPFGRTTDRRPLNAHLGHEGEGAKKLVADAAGGASVIAGTCSKSLKPLRNGHS
jgi:hypothetical protein